MYKESIIGTKAQALALINWKSNLLFYRDESGHAIHANKEKVESAWGLVDFFTCTYPNPRRLEPISVRMLIGANAYACITKGGRKTDILLQAGKSAQSSLREYAVEQRERAKRILEMADLAEMAADKLDSEKESRS